VLFTVGGTPSVYSGDVPAFRGVKEERAGGDDEIRPAFPADPSELAPEGWATYRLHQDLIGTRRRHPWLHRARTEVVHLTNTELVYRASAESESLLVALNLGPTAARLPAPGSTTVIAGTATLTPDQAEIPPQGWAVLA
jgi:cyclomaltodextrinase